MQGAKPYWQEDGREYFDHEAYTCCDPGPERPLLEQEPETQQDKEERKAIEKADKGIHGHKERSIKPATFEGCVLLVEFQGNEVNQHEVACFKGQEGKAQKNSEPELLMPPGRDSQAQAVKGREQPGKERRILQPVVNKGIQTIVRDTSYAQKMMVH